MNREKILNIIVILLFIICFIELFYKLGKIPEGINVDEAGSMYDAISLYRFGVDRYLYHNPVYFINYGDGQNALYTYLAVISFKIFGISLFNFRLVNAIISIVSYFYFYKLINKYDTKLKSVFVLLMLTILPVYFMKGRWGLESFLFNPLLIISLYYFVSAIDSENNVCYFVSGILFGITLYTYAISYLILPLFLGFVIAYLIKNKRITISNIIIFGIPLFLFVLPLFLLLMVNNGMMKEIVTPLFSIPKLLNYRGNEISFYNIRSVFFDLIAIFIGDLHRHNTITSFGVMYYISPFLIIMGIFLFIKNKEYKNMFGFLMISLFVSNLISFLFIDILNVNRCNSIYVCLVYFIGYYLEYLFYERKKYMFIFCMSCYLICYVLFINYYFDNYSVSYFIKGDYYEALEFGDNIYTNNKYSKICVNTGGSDNVYTSLYYKLSPYEFNSSDKYVFNCKYVDHDIVYVIKKNMLLYDILVNDEYSIEQIGQYYVMYYK